METVERELAKGVGDIFSLICNYFVFVLRLVTVCFICLFVQVGDEELGIALMWAASAGKVGDHITNSCLRFTRITLDYQHVMSSECQCRQGEGSDLGNISCLGFAWCLYRDVLWMPVFENYWGNGFDCCSMEKFV